jgi:hypothetical protein
MPHRPEPRRPARDQLKRVHGRGGGEGPPGGGAPFQDAWFRLIEPPPLGLLAVMVVSAERLLAAYTIRTGSATVSLLVLRPCPLSPLGGVAYAT